MAGGFRRFRWPGLFTRTAVFCGGSGAAPLPGRRDEPQRSRVVHFTFSQEDRVQNLHRSGAIGLVTRAALRLDLRKFGFLSNRTPQPLTITKDRNKNDRVACAREIVVRLFILFSQVKTWMSGKWQKCDGCYTR